MAAHVFNAREVRETGAGEQPGAIWSRDTDSYLQLLASPLVSRSPSPGSVEDPEEIPDIELEDDQPMAEAEGAGRDDDGAETVTPEVSSDENETARKARARMAYRSVRRATQGQGRTRLGVTPSTEDTVDMRRFMEARVATLRRFQQMVDVRRVADAEAAWQERLARLQEEEEALWAPTTEQPEPTQPLARQLPPTPLPPQPPLPLTLTRPKPASMPTPPRPPHTPSTPPPHGRKWRVVPTEDWPSQVAEEAARQGARNRRVHWAKLFELGGQRYRLKVRRGGEVRVTVAE
ncbi:GM13563 [Drosophila sechellia]|uniref:GM13563 n=1 Tax=Drosophila sechellia TaxID=7238 RepID=B4INZ2_DROSE|nr:GM13563 [Drosophila sechellia]